MEVPYKRGNGRYPKPRGTEKQRKRKLEQEVSALYAEVVEGETVLSLRLPNWRNAEAIAEAALAAITKVANQDGNVEIALKAGIFLLDYATRQMERGGKQLEGNAVMARLEQLYRKALPVEAESVPLVVEEEPNAQ